MSEHVAVTIEGICARITLRRPDKLNALDRAMVIALADAAETIEAASAVRVADPQRRRPRLLRRRRHRGLGRIAALEMWRDWTRVGHRAFEALARLRVPLIAALTGHAFGGGLELAAAADIRIAESGFKFGLPETGLGMVPGWSGTQRLVRRFGAQTVRRMALTGKMFTAEEALALGLVDEVVAVGEGLARAEAVAADIALRGPIAVQIVKSMINAAEGEDRDAPIEAIAGALTAMTQDLEEGVAAFRAKRPAQFTGQ